MASEATGLDRQVEYHGPGAARWPDLSDVLLAGEQVAFVSRARVLTSRVPRFTHWYVIVTDQRLICLRDTRRAARHQLHVTLQQIDHVYQRGIIRSQVVVATRNGRLRFLGLGRAGGGRLVSLLMAPVRELRAQARLPNPAAPALGPGVPPEAVLNRVEELELAVDELTRQVAFLENLLRSRQQ
jgi:hypothetical protein